MKSRDDAKRVEKRRTRTHAKAKHVQDGPRHHASDHPGGDEVVDGVREQHAQRVDLLGDLHGP